METGMEMHDSRCWDGDGDEEKRKARGTSPLIA